ncbi:MAG: hypothetical protein DRG78_01855 [Epsilonproteobacteria bacterium]|nr:MAG: hypothetical protein DRG78_01855 [Campylobacterota bacterium]
MLKIGITGHRNLNNSYINKYKLKSFHKLSELKKEYSNIIIYSALADGADRLVVHEALKLNIDFIAILPMDKNQYKTDFCIDSKKEFDSLLEKSKEIVTIPIYKKSKRDLQYELVGQYISDNCDILFALWDDKYNNLQGGTSEIVKYHLEQNKQLYHIKVDRNSI